MNIAMLIGNWRSRARRCLRCYVVENIRVRKEQFEKSLPESNLEEIFPHFLRYTIIACNLQAGFSRPGRRY